MHEMRLTPARQAVLDVLREAHDHPSAAEIFERVRFFQSSVSYATIYNALNVLVASGLVRELDVGEEAARFDGRVDTHDHVVCDACGIVADVPAALAPDASAVAARASGFRIDEWHVQFRGLCPRCAKGSP